MAKKAKEKKKSGCLKWVIIVTVILVVLSAIAGDDGDNENSSPSTETQTVAETKISTQEEVDEFAVIDTFIEKYNSTFDNQITDISEMDIQGEDYRTEFRLNAFENALGKKGVLSNGTIDIVNYGTWKNDSIRIYASTDSNDSAIDLCTEIIHTLDNTITDKEIQECYDLYKMTHILFDSANYISGYVHGNEIMIDCTEIKFMD